MSFRISLQHWAGRCHDGRGTPFAGLDGIVVGKADVIDVDGRIGNVVDTAVGSEQRGATVQPLLILYGASGNIEYRAGLGDNIATRIQRYASRLREFFGNSPTKVVEERGDIRQGRAFSQINGNRLASEKAISLQRSILQFIRAQIYLHQVSLCGELHPLQSGGVYAAGAIEKNAAAVGLDRRHLYVIAVEKTVVRIIRCQQICLAARRNNGSIPFEADRLADQRHIRREENLRIGNGIAVSWIRDDLCHAALR